MVCASDLGAVYGGLAAFRRRVSAQLRNLEGTRQVDARILAINGVRRLRARSHRRLARCESGPPSGALLGALISECPLGTARGRICRLRGIRFELSSLSVEVCRPI